MPGQSRHHAPPVSYPTGRFVWGDRLAGALWCLALLGWAWGVEQGAGWVDTEVPAHPRLVVVAGALCLLVVGAALWRRARAWPRGWLSWGQGQWMWQADGGAPATSVMAVRIALDAQDVLCLRLHGAGGLPRWVCLSRRDQPERWDDVRRAVWATRRGQADHVSAPGGALGIGYISRPRPPP